MVRSNMAVNLLDIDIESVMKQAVEEAQQGACMNELIKYCHKKGIEVKQSL